MSCMRAAYSRSTRSASDRPELAADGQGQLADPPGVAGLGVAADLGHPGQRADRLARRSAGCLRTDATENWVEQQRDDEDRDGPAAHDLRGEGDQHAGRADRRADARTGHRTSSSAARQVRRPVAVGADQRGDRGLEQAGEAAR